MLVARQIDHLVVDPFVSSHDASENDNTAKDHIVKASGWVDAPYRSGPSKNWRKLKNPASEAARCEGERNAGKAAGHAPIV
ncbi:hypothetical protein ACKWRH_27655 [Bradyrhizobium sp. Pa8]|uniref:hypothetical protein n=1 Tax=Bradyrhizobium sp. Pa8 TaxID=3386552 RepID=UPI00403F0474